MSVSNTRKRPDDKRQMRWTISFWITNKIRLILDNNTMNFILLVQFRVDTVEFYSFVLSDRDLIFINYDLRPASFWNLVFMSYLWMSHLLEKCRVFLRYSWIHNSYFSSQLKYFHFWPSYADPSHKKFIVTFVREESADDFHYDDMLWRRVVMMFRTTSSWTIKIVFSFEIENDSSDSCRFLDMDIMIWHVSSLSRIARCEFSIIISREF